MAELEGARYATVSSTSRVEAFSDGVMAIAITLLVLDLRVPTELETAAAGGLLPALLAKWPNYVAYLAGFFTIGIIWLNHHALVNAIRRFDWRLMWLNLLLLLGVATLPFTTAVMAEYVATGGTDATVAAAFYGALALVMAVPWTLIWMHLRDHPRAARAGLYGRPCAGRHQAQCLRPTGLRRGDRRRLHIADRRSGDVHRHRRLLRPRPPARNGRLIRIGPLA